MTGKTERTSPSVDTLVEDIYRVLSEGVDESDLSEEAVLNLGVSIADHVRQALSKKERERKPYIRISNVGQPCNRKLYYEINNPDDKEELQPSARLKFLFGHILEDLLLYLAEVSGHKVEGRQDEIELAGVKGHRDAIIDGTIIDVKSASTYSFKKFENHELASNDPFGYLTQIESYRRAGESDDRVTDKERCGFFVVDKTLGNLCLDFYGKQSFPVEKLIEYKKDMVSKPEPPSRGFQDEPEGKSGNRKLGLNCSYCDFKNLCWPGLKTYAYSRGPVFLTKVVKEPKVDQVS